MALYNTERPRTFADMRGQDKIVNLFRGILKSGNIPNAFLFVGVRGTGKTTSARIWARALNCEHPTDDGPCNECASCKEISSESSIDVIELDAASHNKVEDVQKIIDATKYMAVGKKKIFILDEIHMLTDAAWNCLLKIIEEPPANCVFIFCTTEEHKVKATILSRCRIFRFEAIDENVIADTLKEICNRHEKKYEENALMLIAKAAKGSLRDAESILDNFFHEEVITASQVSDVLGISEDSMIFQILYGIASNKPKDALDGLGEAVHRGKSLQGLLHAVCTALKDAIFVMEGGSMERVVSTAEYKEELSKLSDIMTVEKALHMMASFSKVYESSLRDGDMEFQIEVTILRLIHEFTDAGEEVNPAVSTPTIDVASVTSLLEQIDDLKKKVEDLEGAVYDGLIPDSRQQAEATTDEQFVKNEGNNLLQTVPEVKKESTDSFLPTDEDEIPFAGSVVVGEQEVTNVSLDISMDVTDIPVPQVNSGKAVDLSSLLPKGAQIGESISLQTNGQGSASDSAVETSSECQSEMKEQTTEINNAEMTDASAAGEETEKGEKGEEATSEEAKGFDFLDDSFDFARQF